MKTLINIGTNQGNLQEVEVNKPFEDIKYREVFDIARKKFPEGNLLIHGWVDVSSIKKDEIEEGFNTPSKDGWYIVTYCWDIEEGTFTNVLMYKKGQWAQRLPITSYKGPYSTEAEAKKNKTDSYY